MHYFEELGVCVTVKRNDKLTLEEVANYEAIVLSPGPGVPDEAGLLKAIIKKYAPTKKIFGVCLGQQAIGEVFGASLKNLDEVYHGVATPVKVDPNEILFKGFNEEITVGRYHSWVIDENTMPDCLIATATDASGQIMAIRHKEYDVSAVQFHPESVLTPKGKDLLKNWINS